MLFRAALLRTGAVQGCSPQAVGLQLGLAIAAFKKSFRKSFGKHVGSHLAAFGKPFGTANGSVQEVLWEAIWEVIWDSKLQHLGSHLRQQMTAFREPNLLKYRALDWN